MFEIFEEAITRRDFLIRIGLVAAATGLTNSSAFGAVGDILSPERRLSLYNTHTGERLDAVYWTGDKYLPDALSEINHILRDHRTESVRPIDTHLLDLLHALNRKLCAKQPFHIISGYRSPKTNKLLRKQSKKVASKSLHMKGKAIDIRLPGCELRKLRKAALELKGGGVGLYSRLDFLHLDTGRFRLWGA
jgi:uncharacterized protein YcbK (DUF882 family)